MNAPQCCVIHTLPVLFLVLLRYFHQENYNGHVACMKEKNKCNNCSESMFESENRRIMKKQKWL